MSCVWTFGDSFTEPYNPNYSWSNEYIKWKNRQPKVYADFIGETLDMEVKNLGVGGTDNYTIFESFCKNVMDIGDNDILIFGWSGINRFRIPTKDDNWRTILVDSFDENKVKFKDTNYSFETIKEIVINRNHKLYINEINWWMIMIEHVMKPRKCLFWSPFKPIDEFNVLYFDGIETVKSETGGYINDIHFSENGQKNIADLLIQHIKGKLI